MKKRIFFFDLARCLAATAVIAIHVLAPYRNELGIISFGEWVTAVSINSISRWAVPVFILITGALLLSDTRPFNLRYYIRRRLSKVLIPFIVWSLFYAYLSGWSAQGFDATTVKAVLADSLSHETYYHLGFFYYFIPLYLVIPFFQLAIQQADIKWIYAFTCVWLITTLLFLLKIDGPWSWQMWLYSGYLPLGYILYKKIPITSGTVAAITLLGVSALSITIYAVVSNSLANEEYTIGRWMSYKTLNVVLAASMVFMLCRYFGENLPKKVSQIASVISRHSLGIYLLHPIFLWPMKEYGWYQGHPGWVIPLWIVISGSGALAVSWLLSCSRKTAWLLP
ncbi:acyltransferase [Oleidesulfovibrio sp.]|uniref:acyltransferase n=1 Tax=Oleidesulfovibrio sp. TaxID=2909707 RepID=UPI003A89D23D